MQQASEVVSALSDFARGDEQIVLADVNSTASGVHSGGDASNVYEYFAACGYRCAYRAVGQAARISPDVLPRYTTWAGWASGDYLATCDHIFVSKGIHVSAVLDVPELEKVAAAFPERLCALNFDGGDFHEQKQTRNCHGATWNTQAYTPSLHSAPLDVHCCELVPVVAVPSHCAVACFALSGNLFQYAANISLNRLVPPKTTCGGLV
eukprot:TRINITY_DN25718_c0_g1_i1.p1 TRINITY_DN25718_c0_g1~~TRINITY_DN25718_c0_g1_i1.p1  ORF type:complete len:232 (-),score=24.51 TRINITY_DN25718_c0_g1_i1:331-954(-)